MAITNFFLWTLKIRYKRILLYIIHIHITKYSFQFKIWNVCSLLIESFRGILNLSKNNYQYSINIAHEQERYVAYVNSWFPKQINNLTIIFKQEKADNRIIKTDTALALFSYLASKRVDRRWTPERKITLMSGHLNLNGSTTNWLTEPYKIGTNI